MEELKASGGIMGFYVVVEGIDGCGKDTFIRYLSDHLSEISGYDVKDLRASNKSEFDKINSNKNIILVAEPTHLMIGRLIRKDVVTSKSFNSKAQAEFFSLDRYTLLNSHVVPWLKQNNIILSSRSFISSIAYQSISGDKELSLDYILNLAGNELAINNPPNIVIILETPTKKALENLYRRTNKQDNAVFEKEEFLEKLSATYSGKRELSYKGRVYSLEGLLRELFGDKTIFKRISNNQGLEELDSSAKELAEEISKYAKNKI